MRAVLSSSAALDDKPPPSGSVVDTDPEKPRSTFKRLATPVTYRPHSGTVDAGSTMGSVQLTSLGWSALVSCIAVSSGFAVMVVYLSIAIGKTIPPV